MTPPGPLTPPVRGLLVITGPRATVAELALLLESPELGRRPGDPPLPLDPPTGGEGLRPRRPPTAMRDRAPARAEVTGPLFARPGAGLLEVRYTVTARGSSAAAAAELARRIPEIDVVLTESTQDGRTRVTTYRADAGDPLPDSNGAIPPVASGRRPGWAEPRTRGGTRG